MRIFFLTLAALSVTSLAYDIVIINDSPNTVLPFVESLGKKNIFNMGGYIRAGRERVYDNANVNLNSAAIAVEEGDTRPVTIYNIVTNELISCGSIKFEDGTVLTYKGDECVKTSAALVTNTDGFQLFAPYVSYGWTVENFDTGDVFSTRTYATGPTKLIWSSKTGTTTIVYQAVEHTTKQIVNINLKAYGSNPCRHSLLINNAAGCSVPRKNYLHAVYEAAMNPDLPAGSYSGIAKLFGRKWHGGEEINTYLNIEIKK